MHRGPFSRALPLLLAVCTLCAVGESLAQSGYHFGRNKIQYSGFEWQILRTPHFDIYYYPEMEELAEMGAHFAEEIYDELENRFEFSLTHRVPMIFYSSNLHFKETNVTPGFIPDGVGGFFEFLKGRVVVPANGNIHHFRRVIRHEVVHVFTHSKITRVMRDHRQVLDRFLPLWFTEGLAEYWSGEPDFQHEMVLRDAVASNYLVPLRNIFRITGTYLMYKQGEAILRFISERYGEEKILRLMENFWKDRNFEKVVEVTLHERFEDVSDEWEHWVRSHYYRMLEDTDTPVLASKGIAGRGFNAKPVFYEYPNGDRYIFYVGNKTGYSNVYSVRVDSLYRPIEKENVLISGERNATFEAFHLLESRLDVSPAGLLAFSTKSGGQDVLHIYDVHKDELTTTLRFPEQIAIYSPAWGPSGDELVFSSIDQTGFSDLYHYDFASAHLRRLTNDMYDDRDPDLSPDGRFVVFSSDRTSFGMHGARNIFVYDLESDHVRYVTYGDQNDFSPRWSPDGTHVIYTSARRDSTGRFGGQDVWVTDISDLEAGTGELASRAELTDLTEPSPADLATRGRTATQLTRLTGAAFDPIWTPDDKVVLSMFEHFKFTIRRLDDIDSLLANPKSRLSVPLGTVGRPWSFSRFGERQGASKERYKRRYNLDIAQSQVSQNPIWGTSGGAFLAFSDMLGDDYWNFALFSNSNSSGDFLRSLSFAVSRVQLHRRANTSYGIFRFSGQRYDITDPDAAVSYPVFWETIWGGFAGVSYPLSKFRRLDFSTGVAWSDKEVFVRNVQRKALLLSNAVALVHDNALYSMNGPVDGWRASLLLAYTSDLRYSNVSYYTLGVDIRRYWRLPLPVQSVTFATRATGRFNHGREARLHILGGSWDLRGYRRWSIRGQKMWFTSQELRFPILRMPSLYIPLLAPFGIADLRGAFFFDMAHAWNFAYDDVERDLNTGRTIGSAGWGFRMNMFGVIVLRYDMGYRHVDFAKEWDNDMFQQFFFGFDF